jgi:hypothetical protein
MTEPNEQQAELIRKHKYNPNRQHTLNPNNWLVLAETEKKLIILNKRKCRRMTLRKEIEE